MELRHPRTGGEHRPAGHDDQSVAKPGAAKARGALVRRAPARWWLMIRPNRCLQTKCPGLEEYNRNILSNGS